MPRPRSGEWLEDEVRTWRIAGVDIVVSLLTREEIVDLGLQEEPRICDVYGIAYLSFPIFDRQVPASQKDTMKLIHEVRQAMKQGKSVAIHCRMGIGRSATIAASVLVSQGEDVKAVFEAITHARGLEVPDTDEQKAWVAENITTF